ncbi:MAG: hypothetical protein ACLQU4_04925 [Limisphaerales bacterium]
MRRLILMLVFGFGLFSSHFAANSQAQVQVTLSWNAATSASLAGYYLAWGLSSRVYSATNTYPASQTTGTISNLAYGTVYYIAVAAFASNGLVSPFSTELTFSSNAPVAVTPPVVSTPPAPPAPPLPPGGVAGSAPPPSIPGSGTSAAGRSGSSSSSGLSASAASTNVVQAQIWGIPPLLRLTVSNGQPNLNIGGTVGATVEVQSTTNLASPFSWTTITNVALTNVAPIESNAVPDQPQDAIDLAFVPAAQVAELPTTTAAARMQFFRVIQPYDYVILAGQVLPPQGYAARLIVVNMPGLNDDACYVTQAGSFIHYTWTNSALQLEGSGSTIRQIATTLAGSLNLDWTTASEFIYSNGVGEILATVVETDPASSDPVAGTTPTSTIAINF